MEYILNILELKYILLQCSVLFLHVGVIVVWLGSGKDHVWAENTWKSPQTSNTSSGLLLTNVTTSFCSVTQHEHQLINMWGERDTEHLVEMSTAGFAEMLNADILFSDWKTSLRVLNVVSVWGFQSGGLSRWLSWRALFSTEMSILTCGADEDS